MTQQHPIWLMFQRILIDIYLLYVARNRKGHKFWVPALLNIVLAALQLPSKASKSRPGEGPLVLKKLFGTEKGSYAPKHLPRNPLRRSLNTSQIEPARQSVPRLFIAAWSQAQMEKGREVCVTVSCIPCINCQQIQYFLSSHLQEYKLEMLI